MASFGVHPKLTDEVRDLHERDPLASASLVALLQTFSEASNAGDFDLCIPSAKKYPFQYDVGWFNAARQRGFNMFRLKWFDDASDPFGYRVIMAHDNLKEAFYALAIYPRGQVYNTARIWRELCRRYRFLGVPVVPPNLFRRE